MVASQEFGTFFEGGFGIVASDAEGVENTKVVHSTIAYEVEALTPTVSICPAAGVTYSWVESLNTLAAEVRGSRPSRSRSSSISVTPSTTLKTARRATSSRWVRCGGRLRSRGTAPASVGGSPRAH